MSRLTQSLALLLGMEPKKPAPEKITKRATAHHEEKSGGKNKEELKQVMVLRAEKAAGPKKWRRIRWSVLIIVNLLFILSYRVDLQLVEGALTGSRFVGFHMADLNAALQVMLAYKQVLINLLIGIVTVFIIWWLLGGRTFCSWVCPYHFFAELAEMLHRKLARKGLVKDHKLDRRMRTVLWLIFAVLAFATGYTVYETISPTGIVSRALIYGPGLAVLWVLAILAVEVFYSKRAWCRYGCPIGLTYGLVGATSPLKVVHDLSKCHHDGACRAVCLVPHVLDFTKKGRAAAMKSETGADCTRCARCIDACPTNALQFKFKGLDKI